MPRSSPCPSYDALLADELARRLPVEWSLRDRGPRRNPTFEVDGIGEDLLAHFSTRAEAIHCAEQEWLVQFETTHDRAPTRVETTRARRHLTRATRPPKTVRPLADLLADWANRARALIGIEPRDLAARALAGAYGRPLHAHDVGTEVRAAMVAQVLDGVSTRRLVWTTWNLGAAAVRPRSCCGWRHPRSGGRCSARSPHRQRRRACRAGAADRSRHARADRSRHARVFLASGYW